MIGGANDFAARPLAAVAAVQEYDFEESVGYWLTLTTQAYHRALNDELTPQGITYRQMQVMGWLMLCGQLSQAELAQRMVVEPPTLVGILDRMEREGWVRRTACPHDRRKKLVALDPAAAPAWEKVTATARKIRQQATLGLSPEQVEQFKQLLRIVLENVSANPGDSPEPAETAPHDQAGRTGQAH